MNPLAMTDAEIPGVRSARMRDLVSRVVSLLDAASRDLEHSREAAKSSIVEAASLLQEQMGTRANSAGRDPDSRGLLAWQARRVRDYIDSHLGTPIRVADLGDLVQRSEAHFSRAFKRTFGEAPHAYLVRRRVECAGGLMLASEAPLSEIALKCGFTDQAHLCKQFRQYTGETPAAWRRARRGETGG